MTDTVTKLLMSIPWHEIDDEIEMAQGKRPIPAEDFSPPEEFVPDEPSAEEDDEDDDAKSEAMRLHVSLKLAAGLQSRDDLDDDSKTSIAVFLARGAAIVLAAEAMEDGPIGSVYDDDNWPSLDAELHGESERLSDQVEDAFTLALLRRYRMTDLAKIVSVMDGDGLDQLCEKGRVNLLKLGNQ